MDCWQRGIRGSSPSRAHAFWGLSGPEKQFKARIFRALILPRCLQHVFNENSIPNVRRVDQDVGDGADELAVLDDGAAGHE